MTKFISAFSLAIALVATLAAADQGAGAGAGVGSGDANGAAGAGANAGGKAGTETGAGKGTEGAQPAAKGAGNTAAAAGTDITLETLPASVKSAVTKEASAQEISSIRERTEGGKLVYDVEVRRGGKLETISFDEQGQRVEQAAAGAPRQQ